MTAWPWVIDLGAGGVIKDQKGAGGQVQPCQGFGDRRIGAGRHPLVTQEGSAQRRVLRWHGLLPGCYLFYPDHISRNGSTCKANVSKHPIVHPAPLPASLAQQDRAASTPQSPVPAPPARGGPAHARQTERRADDTTMPAPTHPRLMSAGAPPDAD